MVTAMAFAAFADAPVDAAIIEVGMGGTWDATNVADAQVAVITPIGVDHQRYLGDRPEIIAVEKAGIIKPGSHIVIAQQEDAVMDVLMRRAVDVGAIALREGIDFVVNHRITAVGGQQIDLQGVGSAYSEIFLPLHGAHQAHNAVYALVAVEAFTGSKELDPDLVRDAFAQVTSPGRLEVVRRSPTVLLDAAHNPHGARATVEAVQDAFTFSPLIGVVSMMADKEVEEMLRIFEPVMAEIVCTQNSTPRAMPAAELAEIAGDIFGAERVIVEPRLDDALERAVAMADSAEGHEEAIGSGGVLVTGSVVTVGEARVLFGGTPS
jgi:dihydrofolate synthase/folylpolyglutamate synthase